MNIVLNMHGIRRLGPSGVGTYCRGLINGLARIDRENRYLIFTGNDRIPNLPDRFTTESIDTASKVSALYFQSIGIARRMKRFRPHLLHSLKTHLNPWKSCPAIITIHDLIFLRRPEFYPASWKMYWKPMVMTAARLATAVIADSHNTAADVRDLLGVPGEKIHVVHLGAPDVAPAAATERPPHPSPYYLYVGNITVRKNVDGLVRAFDLCKQRFHIPHDLIVVGNLDWKGREILDGAARCASAASIAYRGYVSNEELSTLYRNAAAFVYLSHYEGFGLPVLEAMAHGCPVVAARTSSLPEVAGEAALLVDPDNVEEIASAMERCASSPELRSDLVRRGYERASRFTWEKTAEETLNVYRRVAGDGHA